MSTVVRLSLRLGIKDPELRAKLTPDYAPLCKRIVVSGTFYETMQKDHVDLVTERIDRIEPGGVVTGDGVLHELDVLVLATGFEAQAYMRPMEITGVDGLTLTEAWADGPSAYRTIAAPGFPNMFTLVGPHSPVGNISIICVAETQTKYVMQCLDRVRQRDTIAIVPKASASDAYNAERELAAPNTAAASGCSSWYLGADGKPAIWPWTPARFHEMLSRPAFEEFELLPAAVPALSTKGPAFKRASGTAR
jgi:cation diffusion facilitator CzcD-associated flavoprotein CzcO